jgi:hypothetical protein
VLLDDGHSRRIHHRTLFAAAAPLCRRTFFLGDVIIIVTLTTQRVSVVYTSVVVLINYSSPAQRFVNCSEYDFVAYTRHVGVYNLNDDQYTTISNIQYKIISSRAAIFKRLPYDRGHDHM